MSPSSTRRVERADILDLETYERERDAIRARALRAKSRRRVHLGEHLTFLFENEETLRYQVQEMLRIERRSSEADIEHEIRTYNELLGPAGGLGCTLLIEIEDAQERDRLLQRWVGLPKHLHAELQEGRRVRARFDARQVGDTRLSSVQYLQFDCQGAVPVALVCDHPELTGRVELTPVQRAALAEDLRA